MHTLGFSTANIERFLRRNGHMFTKDGVRALDMLDEFPEFDQFPPQDENVNLETDNCRPRRHAVETIISNATLNDSSTTIRIDIYECGMIVPGATEIWYLIPVRCENANTAMGMNIAAIDNSPRSCGEVVHWPGRATDNGLFIIAALPRKGCGCNSHPWNGRW